MNVIAQWYTYKDRKRETREQDTQIKHLNLPEPKPNLIVIDSPAATLANKKTIHNIRSNLQNKAQTLKMAPDK